MLPLVGRAAELEIIGSAWSSVHADGLSRVVMITGDPGVGKSRLVTEALAALSPRPPSVLAGQARSYAPAPYDWMASAFSGRTDVPGPADALAWLRQEPDAPPRRFAPGSLLRVAVDAVRSALDSALDSAPGVLVAEDLHDLDPASLTLIADLAAAPALPALIIVTSRPPASALAARVLARLTGTPRAARLHLGPLSEAEVATLLAAEPAVSLSRAAAAVHRRTGGNAFWLTELVVTARATADPIAALTDGPLPPQLAALVELGPVELGPTGSPIFGPVNGDGGGANGGGSNGGGGALTAREREVLDHIASGRTNQQIASALGISVRTVTVHVSNLLRKIGAASRTEAALWAVRQQR